MNSVWSLLSLILSPSTLYLAHQALAMLVFFLFPQTPEAISYLRNTMFSVSAARFLPQIFAWLVPFHHSAEMTVLRETLHNILGQGSSHPTHSHSQMLIHSLPPYLILFPARIYHSPTQFYYWFTCFLFIFLIFPPECMLHYRHFVYLAHHFISST